MIPHDEMSDPNAPSYVTTSDWYDVAQWNPVDEEWELGGHQYTLNVAKGQVEIKQKIAKDTRFRVVHVFEQTMIIGVSE